MATQLKPNFSHVETFARAPDIRVAFVGGKPATAIAAASLLPAHFAERTLDEIVLQRTTEQLIATAERLLSPAMYLAFLSWGEATSRFMTQWFNDDDGNARAEAHGVAIDRVIALTPQNQHDWCFRVYLTALTAADGSDFGPLDKINSHYGRLLDQHLIGLRKDFAGQSPLPGLLGEIGLLASEIAPSKVNQWGPESGSIITAVFAEASCREARHGGTFNVRALGWHGTGSQTDVGLMRAYRSYAAELKLGRECSFENDAEEEESDERMIAAEHLMHATRATTIEGVLAKLRVCFQRQTDDAWGIGAVLDPSAPDFRRGVESDHMFAQMFWSSIEDLARISGIKLAEHRG